MISPRLFNRIEAAFARVDIAVFEVADDTLMTMFERASARGYTTLESYLRAERPRLMASAGQPHLLRAQL